MSESRLEAALVALQKPQDSSGLLKALIAVRKQVEWPQNKDGIARLREKGCLKQLTEVLQTPGQKGCVDLGLSILGNCMMDRGCSREVVVQHNILSIINQLFKKHPKEDSINGRLFRIVGNMCQHRDLWANVIIDRKPYIVTHIVDTVRRVSKDDSSSDDKISDATVIMALKSLRELLNSQTIMQLVKGFGVLKAVGALFIKYSEQWRQSKQNEKLLLDIVKLFQEYSRYKYYQSILEMRNTERGDSLVHLSDVLVLAPRRVVKIVMNFIRISQLKSELPIPEICGKFIEALDKHSILKEFEDESIEYLQCLCYLLDHPANRSNERCGQSIPLLVKVLKEFEHPSNVILESCILLLATLNKFKYDDSLLLAQLRCGIVQIIIDKLRWLVGGTKTLSVRHESEKKRKYIFGPSGSSPDKLRRFNEDTLMEVRPSSPPGSSDDEFDFCMYARLERSPSPCSSSDSWASPSPSPDRTLAENGASDSDDYSPVCSEADNADFPLPQDVEEDEEVDLPLLDSFEPIEPDEELEYEHSTDKSLSQSLKVGLLIEITKLLKSYAKLRPPAPQLADEDLLLALVKCSGPFQPLFCSNVDTIDVVCKILDSHEYLLPLMETEFVQTIYGLTEVQHSQWCAKCAQYLQVGQTILRKLSTLAESGAGRGEIAHKLLRGPVNTQERLVLAIPYIVRNKSVLGKLMLNCGGLEVLMKLLRGGGELNKRSVTVLCSMAVHKLAIANPRKINSSMNCPKVVADRYKPPSDTCSNVVTFVLDDGTRIAADREFLVTKSDFFRLLLSGDFKESKEKEIALPSVEAKSLRCLLHLLATVDKSETIEIDLDLDILLDVIVLCDRFLLIELCMSLTDSVEQFRISASTVPTIYGWSVESGTNLLRVESVAFALVAEADDSERYAMFERLFALGYPDELVDDIQKLLVRYLTLGDYTERLDALSGKRKNIKLNLLKGSA